MTARLQTRPADLTERSQAAGQLAGLPRFETFMHAWDDAHPLTTCLIFLVEHLAY
jgi:hypothetical protein